MTAAVVHIAGSDVTVNSRTRQRCAWCGAVLMDMDLANVAVPVGQDPTIPTWPVGDLMLRDGSMTATLPHNDGDQLPDNACARLDPEVTR